MEFLKDYYFELKYHLRKANIVVDALSGKFLQVACMMVQETNLLQEFRDMNLDMSLIFKLEYVQVRNQYQLERDNKNRTQRIISYLLMVQCCVTRCVHLYNIKQGPTVYLQNLESFSGSSQYQTEFQQTYHPKIDGQSKRTIQTLEDMLKNFILDESESWDKYLPLVEFSYKNSYHSSIDMSSYEALYGRNCRSPLCWCEVWEKSLL